MLLLQTGVITKKKDSIDQGDVEKFARFSLDFEKANILTPILSAFEIQPTRVRISRLSTKKLNVSMSGAITSPSTSVSVSTAP